MSNPLHLRPEVQPDAQPTEPTAARPEAQAQAQTEAQADPATQAGAGPGDCTHAAVLPGSRQAVCPACGATVEPPKPGRLARVFAGDIDEYYYYIAFREIPHDRAVFVSKAEQLLGLPPGTEVVFTGSFTDHQHYDAVMGVVRDHQLTPKYDTY